MNELQNFDKDEFIGLVGIGCGENEICRFFKDPDGKPASPKKLSVWCKKTFGLSLKDYLRQNKGADLKIQLRKNQLALSEKSVSMAIFLGKNYLGQSSDPADDEVIRRIEELEKDYE